MRSVLEFGQQIDGYDVRVLDERAVRASAEQQPEYVGATQKRIAWAIGFVLALAGTVLAAGPDGIRIACGQDALEITELQRAGGRRLPAGEFLRGSVITPGERLAFAR